MALFGSKIRPYVRFLTTSARRLQSRDCGIKFRPARLTDHAGVVAINTNIYEGRDYVDGLFPSFLQRTDIFPVVAETETGEIVGFAFGELTDGGRSLTLKAGRIKDGFQGQRLSKRIIEMIKGHFRSLPQPYEHEYSLSLNSFDETKFQVGLARDVISSIYPSTPAERERIQAELSHYNPTTSPRLLTRYSFMKMIELYSPYNSEHDWPNKAVIDWTPVDFDECNIDAFIKDTNFCYYSPTKISTKKGPVSTTSKDDPKYQNQIQEEPSDSATELTNLAKMGQPLLVGLGGCFECRIGYAYNLNIDWLGQSADLSSSLDVALVEQHVLTHIHHFMDVANGKDVALCVFVDSRWPGVSEALRALRGRLGMEEGPWHNQYMKRGQK